MPDFAGKLDVLGHDGDALAVDGAAVDVLEQADEVRLARLLQGHDGVRLEAHVRLEVLGDLAHEALEGQLADEHLRGLLVLADLAQGGGAGPPAVGLLYTRVQGGGLAGGLLGQGLAGSLAARGLARSLLGAGHFLLWIRNLYCLIYSLGFFLLSKRSPAHTQALRRAEEEYRTMIKKIKEMREGSRNQSGLTKKYLLMGK